MKKIAVVAMLKELWGYIGRKRRIQLYTLVVLMVFASFAEVVTIGAILPFLGVLTAPEKFFDYSLMRPIVELFGVTEPSELLLPLTIGFIAAALVSGLTRVGLIWAQTRLSYAIGADLSVNIYRRTLYQPYAIHVSRNSSEIISGIVNKANVVSGYTIMPAMTILNSVMLFISILFALVAIEPVIALTAICGFGLIYGLVIVFSKNHLSRYSRQINEKSDQIIKTLQEGLGGIRDVLLDKSQEAYVQVYEHADYDLRRAQANVQIIGTTPRYGVETLGMIMIAILAYVMSKETDATTKIIPVLGVLALGAQRLLPVLQQAYTSLTMMRGGQAVLSDALDLLKQPLPPQSSNLLVSSIRFERSISLENVSFKYGLEEPWVLEGININIPKGSRVGIVGATGSGKSTLMDLLMGLLRPTCGVLKIDDVDVSDLNVASWQEHIAHVPQALFFADSTVMENIAFGYSKNQIDSERVRFAACGAQIGHLIEGWDRQYETIIGERGVRLSGGQRQRIGIARALYKSTDVLIFDEATSALDNETEQAVMDAVENISDEATVLMIAHRLSTLKNCSKIIKLDNGKVVAEGTYEEIVGI